MMGADQLSEPATCHNPLFDEQDVEELVIHWLVDLKNEGKARTVALQRLYRLTDRERHYNRIPVVTSSKFDIIQALIPCIAPEASNTSDRRQALLLINNLCVPTEGKLAVFRGSACKSFLSTLLRVIQDRFPESYLATVCLFNLSLCEEMKSFLFAFVPTSSHNQVVEETTTTTMTSTMGSRRLHGNRQPSEYIEALQNSQSLVRTLETVVKDFSPFLATTHAVVSVEGEVIRWTMGIMRNLATVETIAVAIATETTLPAAAVYCLETSLQANKDLVLWKQNSMEDASLMLLVRLAQFGEVCLQAIRTPEAKRVLNGLQGRGGIHETRAKVLLMLFDHQEPPIPDLQPSRQYHLLPNDEGTAIVNLAEEKKEWV